MGVKLHGPEITALLRGPQGPVMRYLLLLGTKVQAEAKIQVGKDTLQLERSIVKRIIPGNQGFVRVQAGNQHVPYALFHHEGTKPHIIKARKAKALRFTGRDGRIVFRKQVSHPGTKPNRYLVDALRRVIRGG